MGRLPTVLRLPYLGVGGNPGQGELQPAECLAQDTHPAPGGGSTAKPNIILIQGGVKYNNHADPHVCWDTKYNVEGVDFFNGTKELFSILPRKFQSLA